MRVDDLYPFWDAVHEDFVDTVSFLTTDKLDARPFDKAVTIRQIILRFIEAERYWLAHVVGGYVYERPRADSFPDGHALAEASRATRYISSRVLDPLSQGSLRAVRRVPADMKLNHPESNMTIGWIIWHVMEEEIKAWGQVSMRLEEAGQEGPGVGRLRKREDHRN